MDEGCRRARVKGNFGLKLKRNVCTEGDIYRDTGQYGRNKLAFTGSSDGPILLGNCSYDFGVFMSL